MQVDDGSRGGWAIDFDTIRFESNHWIRAGDTLYKETPASIHSE